MTALEHLRQVALRSGISSRWTRPGELSGGFDSRPEMLHYLKGARLMSDELKYAASRACPPGVYRDCPNVEACAADESHVVALTCWQGWVWDYAQAGTDGQEWTKEPATLPRADTVAREAGVVEDRRGEA